MKYRYFFLIIALFSFSLLFISCPKPSPAPEPEETDTLSVSGRIILPDSSGFQTNEIDVLTLFSTPNPVEDDSSFDTENPDGWLFFAQRASDKKVIMCSFDSVISIENTAKALSAMYPPAQDSLYYKSYILRNAETHPLFDDLTSEIEKKIINGNTLTEVDSTLFNYAYQIGRDLYRQSITLRKRIQEEQDGPWLEMNDEDLMAMNPKAIFYGLKIESLESTGDDQYLLVDDKERLILGESAATEIPDGLFGQYRFKFRKGYYSLEQTSKEDSIGMGANLMKGTFQIISLAAELLTVGFSNAILRGDISDFLRFYMLIRSYELMENIATFNDCLGESDFVGATHALLQFVIKACKDPQIQAFIAEFIGEEITEEGIGALGDLAGPLSLVFTANEMTPFFYDLAFAGNPTYEITITDNGFYESSGSYEINPDLPVPIITEGMYIRESGYVKLSWEETQDDVDKVQVSWRASTGGEQVEYIEYVPYFDTTLTAITDDTVDVFMEVRNVDSLLRVSPEVRMFMVLSPQTSYDYVSDGAYKGGTPKPTDLVAEPDGSARQYYYFPEGHYTSVEAEIKENIEDEWAHPYCTFGPGYIKFESRYEGKHLYARMRARKQSFATPWTEFEMEWLADSSLPPVENLTVVDSDTNGFTLSWDYNTTLPYDYFQYQLSFDGLNYEYSGLASFSSRELTIDTTSPIIEIIPDTTYHLRIRSMTSDTSEVSPWASIIVRTEELFIPPDTTESTELKLISYIDSPGLVRDIFVQGNYAYLAYYTGLHIIDVSIPDSINAVSTLGGFGSVFDVIVVDNYAYLTANGGLSIIDISNPSAPFLISSIFLDGSISLAIENGYAYIVTGHVFKVIDISEPSEPTLVYNNDSLGQVEEVLLHENYLLVSSNSRGIYVFDISDPSTPFLITFWQKPAGTRSSCFIAMNNNYIFTGNYIQFHVLDCTHFPNLSYIDEYWFYPLCPPTDPNWNWFVVDNNYAYYGSYEEGFNIVDIEEIMSSLPYPISGHYPGGTGTSICIDGSIAYVAMDEKLYLFDVSMFTSE